MAQTGTNCFLLISIKRLLVNKSHQFVKKFSTQLYLGWVLFIALITLLPGSSIPNYIDWNFLELDKIIHMTVFTVLTFFGCYHFKSRKKNQKSIVIFSLLLAISYGTIIELLQTFIPQRGFDYADLTADVVGAVLGVIVFRFMEYRELQHQ